MCSALVRVDAALLLRLMETQTDAAAAAAVAIFISFRVDLRANDQSCLISRRVVKQEVLHRYEMD